MIVTLAACVGTSRSSFWSKKTIETFWVSQSRSQTSCGVTSCSRRANFWRCTVKLNNGEFSRRWLCTGWQRKILPFKTGSRSKIFMIFFGKTKAITTRWPAWCSATWDCLRRWILFGGKKLGGNLLIGKTGKRETLRKLSSSFQSPVKLLTASSLLDSTTPNSFSLTHKCK